MKTQVGIIWMAMVVSTRLWLGGVVSTRRDQRLITRLVALIAASAQCAPLLLAVDGFASYISAFRLTFRTPERTGKRGAPRKVAWKELCIAQVIKHMHKRRVVEVSRRLLQGSWTYADRLLRATPGCEVLNTAYIERLNGTFRATGTAGTTNAPWGGVQGGTPSWNVSGGRAVQLLHDSCAFEDDGR